MKKRILLSAILVLAACIAAYLAVPKWKVARIVQYLGNPASDSVTLIPNPKTPAEKIVNGAKQEVINRVRYNAAYVSIPYPNGDVPSDRGACTDVVVRALRAVGYDLQKLVHEDMKQNFRLYPKKWGLTKPDANIDHRRVPNLMVFFRRFGKELPNGTTGRDAESWKPGDIVCWDLNGNGLTHTGVISNEKNRNGRFLILHNIGPYTSQQDCLDNWQIIGHFRYPK